MLDDVGGLEAEHGAHGVRDGFVGQAALRGAEGVHIHADGFGVADGVGELDLGALGQTSGDNVLRHIATHVGGAAVHLGGILAGEGPAAVTTKATVAVHDDLAAGQAGVALRSTDDEVAGGVDEEFGLGGEHPLGQHLLDDFLDAELLNQAVLHTGRVLGGDDDVRDGDGLVILIDDGHLGLRVGTQPRGQLPGLADLRELTAEAMREHDRRGHQLRRLVARVAEHQTLVAGTLLGLLLALGGLGIHALRNVGGLLRDDGVHEHLVGVEDIVLVHVTDATDGLAGELGEIELGLRGDLTANDDDVRLHVGFAGDAAVFVLRQTRVQDGVRDRVGDFVRVAFADGFGGEDESFDHA